MIFADNGLLTYGPTAAGEPTRCGEKETMLNFNDIRTYPLAERTNKFHILTESVAGLREGVVLNIGSAVLMPEVFLKALTIARNLRVDVCDFTTANFDFGDMYRPRTRIVEWPKTLGATGFDIRGNHRQTIPMLHRALVGA